jgi:hypothetical protein
LAAIWIENTCISARLSDEFVASFLRFKGLWQVIRNFQCGLDLQVLRLIDSAVGETWKAPDAA